MSVASLPVAVDLLARLLEARKLNADNLDEVVNHGAPRYWEGSSHLSSPLGPLVGWVGRGAGYLPLADEVAEC